MNAVAAFPSAHLSSNMYPSLHAKVCDTRKTDTLHFHNHIQIWYVLKGSMKHFVKDVCFEQKEGSCVCVLPYTVHNIDTRKSSDLPAVVELTFHDEFLLNNNFRFFANSASHAQFEEKTSQRKRIDPERTGRKTGRHGPGNLQVGKRTGDAGCIPDETAL